ncbi:CoA pyrophosphatase [Sphingomonas sp. KRR8]|uniref:CoA pyrophosphatase n=1 Tax=Sphingomonas sp. KRR8 TaxID=2942996 RepID=UPI002021C744|nr:CoA pyrophosphatase [Sphingomonas sp. KRR8]URD62097.1 CoA pyrophosphatase [Sphingomonas sp. KRR8]
MTLAERLRAALDFPPPVGLLPGDLVEGTAGQPVPAAVLVAVTRRSEPGVILTVRRDDLRTHAGQVAFPGGRVDSADAGVTHAALREAQEEVGLDPALVDVWGVADPYVTVTNFSVIPVLGSVPSDLPLVPHEREVADLFEAPLAFLLDPANQRAITAEYQGRMRTYYQIDWEGRRIWGATAAMLVNLSRRLQWS